MNKYNVRAIRTELDGFVRHAAWKKFRTRLQGLDLELRRAVIEHRPTANVSSRRKKRHSATLLHSLCDSVQASPPVPVDLLECILEACPHLLSGNVSQRTPLAIALDRQASPAILECLLMHDVSRRSLYIIDRKTGDTPLLQAIKQQANDDVILLLVGYDTTRQSLLIPSKKRHRVPLFYVANQELCFVNLMDGGDEEIPGELEYILFQTYQALQIQKGEVETDVKVPSILPVENCQSMDDLDLADAFGDQIFASMDDFGDEDLEVGSVLFNGDTEEQYCSNLLRAVLACAHFLGDKHSISLISHLLTRIPDLSETNDRHGNTILHCFCQATHTFANSALLDGRLMTETILQRHERSLSTANAQGSLPLHLALETSKPWENVLRPLVEASPTTVSTANTIDGRLPLHLAIYNYPPRSKEIHNTWKLYPEAASVQDPTKKLFPFQLAAQSRESSAATILRSTDDGEHATASSSQTSKGKGKRKATLGTAPCAPAAKDLDQLSDIFFLLRASPQNLREYV